MDETTRNQMMIVENQIIIAKAIEDAYRSIKAFILVTFLGLMVMNLAGFILLVTLIEGLQ